MLRRQLLAGIFASGVAPAVLSSGVAMKIFVPKVAIITLPTLSELMATQEAYDSWSRRHRGIILETRGGVSNISCQEQYLLRTDKSLHPHFQIHYQRRMDEFYKANPQ